MSISAFMDKHYRHFNAREMVEAAKTYKSMVEGGGKMFMSIAGAMSTAELGISLAEMIRQDKVHAISCTAANFEEDFFNLVAHDEYELCPNYRDLSPEDEFKLREGGFNRVTDTCIPETVIRHFEDNLLEYWQEADQKGEQHFPTDYFFRLLKDGKLQEHYQIPPENSWVLAAYEKGIPVFTPGWEDSTLGNIFAARVYDGTLSTHNVIHPGTRMMQDLVKWYLEHEKNGIGFYQIGGGIAGDFAICAVPLILQDLEMRDSNLWSYFCQISDSTTSFGSYSGAVPNEKITWYKLSKDSPKFMINSDASIVAPLMFSYILGQ
ncbi:deoxyhypusine synthase family protein [Bremerella alba]|uniref:Deoxyhypusine synthase-like protein n=1 Tax=Bremerella alba TaxID=980252 RepID=A0A7V8V7R3_9BACT|nr:deoxyhypusine synthase family protein [Bremerella alba]MBA2116231.1 Deoxyhypusine synthase-like protein [Bremerella alba]